MAEQLASLRQKGGSLSETVLWTNPSRTSGFDAQQVTLSSGISNYKYIKIVYEYGSESAYQSDAYIYEAITSIVELQRDTYNTGSIRNALILAIMNTANDVSGRAYWYVDDTHIRFDISRYFGSAVTALIRAIPLQIIGLN